MVSVGFGRFSKERVIEIFKTLNLIIQKTNRATERERERERERVVKQIRTAEKEKLPIIFVQQYTQRFQHKIENILN